MRKLTLKAGLAGLALWLPLLAWGTPIQVVDIDVQGLT